MERIVIEREFESPVVYDDFRGARDADPGCFERYRIDAVGSFVALDGRRMLCAITAPDAEAVRAVSDMHRVAYSAIWTADVLPGASYAGDATPAALTARDGDFDARPYRRVAIARLRVDAAVDVEAARDAAASVVGAGATHLFSYLRRGGGVYCGVFDHPDPRPTSGDDHLVWPAFARARKRRSRAHGTA